MTTATSSHTPEPSAATPPTPPTPPAHPAPISGLVTAAVVFVIGLLLLLALLICYAYQLEPIQFVSKTLFWLSILSFTSSLGLAISFAIKVEATVEYTIPFLDRKLPIQLKGQLAAIILFIAIGVSIVFLTGQHHQFDNHKQYLLEKARYETLKKDKHHSDRTAALLQSILSGVYIGELHMLRLSVMCGTRSDEIMSNWHRVSPGDGSPEVDHFNSATVPLPISQERRTYRFGKDHTVDVSLSVDVELDAEGVLDGQLNIADANRLRVVCKEFLAGLSTSLGPTHEGMSNESEKAFQ